MAYEYKPTRSELLKLKRRIKLSETGYKLLKMKRDGLIIEFFKVLTKAKDIRTQIVEHYKIAEQRLGVAKAVEGELALNSASFAMERDPKVMVGSQNLMGVLVPTVEETSVKRRIDERGYGIVGASTRIDEAADIFEQLVDDIIVAAHYETTLKRLIDEIERTKRRVNALEFRVIPELKRISAFIRFRLEEMERDNTYRLKHIKEKAAVA